MNAAASTLEKGLMRMVYGQTENFVLCAPLWDGIYLCANHIRCNHIKNTGPGSDWIPVLNCCIDGRCETALPRDAYIYMEKGFMAVGNADGTTTADEFSYPGGFYDGIEVFVTEPDMDTLEEFGLDLSFLNEMAAGVPVSALFRMTQRQMGLASDLFEHLVQADLELPQYRFLALQFLYELKTHGATALEKTAFVTKGQRQIASEIESLISADLSRRYTLQELAGRFGLGEITLRKYFRLVYGESISGYMRRKRIAFARQELVWTRRSVGEIAAACGYENQGKFGEVFRRETGVTPSEYRCQNIAEKTKEGPGQAFVSTCGAEHLRLSGSQEDSK